MEPTRVLGFVAVLLIVGRADTGMPATSFPTTFDLDSTKSTYPFVMRLQGTLQLQADSLVIDVRSGLIRSAIPAHLGEQGIARAQIVAPSLSPGEARSLGPLHFVISGIKGVPIRDRWLAATLRVTQRLPGIPAGPLESYACAEDNLLGATAASRERAKLMRTAYSQTC